MQHQWKHLSSLLRVARLRLVCAVILVLFVPGVRATTTPQHDIDIIIKKIDQLFRAESSRAMVTMQIVTPDWERTLEMEMWTEGTDKTFVRIHSPRKEKGVGTLRIEKEMWNYLPKVGKTIKVPPSMMTTAWMGSDFTNDDIVSQISFITDYTHEFTAGDEEGLLYIRSIPNDGVPVVWGSVVNAVEADGYLPRWARYYDEKGGLMRSFEFSEPKTFGTRRIPSILTVVPANKQGNKTVIVYDDMDFDIDIDNDIFTLRHLRSTK